MLIRTAILRFKLNLKMDEKWENDSNKKLNKHLSLSIDFSKVVLIRVSFENESKVSEFNEIEQPMFKLINLLALKNFRRFKFLLV